MPKTIPGIKRVGSIIGLKPEFEERYIILHKHTFPDVLKRIRLSHIRNYSIFLKDGILFSYFEYSGKKYAVDLKAIAEDQTTREWWKLTDPMQQPLPIREKGEWWAVLEEAVHAGTSARSSPVKRFAFVGTCPQLGRIRTKLAESPASREFQSTLIQCRIHNLSLYAKVAIGYAYFEYSGRNFKADLAALNASSDQLFREESLHACLRFSEAPWAEMLEVFHAD